MYELTKHAERRMAQRGFSIDDAALIAQIGTEVPGGYLVRAQDCQQIEMQLKRLLDRVRRLEGKRIVVASGCIVTAYRPARRKERRLLRDVQEREFNM